MNNIFEDMRQTAQALNLHRMGLEPVILMEQVRYIAGQVGDLSDKDKEQCQRILKGVLGRDNPRIEMFGFSCKC